MRLLAVVVPLVLALVLVLPAHATSATLPQRTDLASPPPAPRDVPLASFVHLSDIHLVDDDAWTLRVEYLDALASKGSPLPFGAAWRPQEEYTDEVFATQVRAINAQTGLDFVIATGDTTDNDMENEVVRALDIARGTVTTTGPVSGATYTPDAQGNDPWRMLNPLAEGLAPGAFTPSAPSLVAAGLPDALRDPGANPGLRVPFYLTLGNHDHLAQGNAPGYLFKSASAAHGRLFLHGAEFSRTLFGGTVPCAGGAYTGAPGDGAGLGFAADRLCDGDAQNDGYYSWAKGPVRFVVLDTANDDVVSTNKNLGRPSAMSLVDGGSGVGGRDGGALDVPQFGWLRSQLDAARAAGETVLLFSHHDPAMWFYPAQSASLGFVTGPEVQALVASYDNVAGYFTGHGHDERVTPIAHAYWDVQTGSLIDLPQEGRRVDVSYQGAGVVKIALHMIASDCALDAGHAALQSACVDSHALSWADPQRDEAHVGGPLDRDVALYAHVGPTAQARLDGL